jgi:hypothetical protein
VASSTVHILSQYVWPDDAPTAVYACQLGDALVADGHRVVLVGGQGQYRQGQRPAPSAPIVRVSHVVGPRGHLLHTWREYQSLLNAYRAYVRQSVTRSDVVIATSAPPGTPWLFDAIRAVGARGIYWLQDYYPELLRGLVEYPTLARLGLKAGFNRALARWDAVVKIASNLGYDGENEVLIRNWATLMPALDVEVLANTALYSGNLGFGHDIPSLVTACETLIDLGWRLTLRADGPGVSKLPAWLEVQPLLDDPADLARSYAQAAAHLIAGHPLIDEAIFPSKIWNALATGRPVIASGFGPRMRRELELSRSVNQSQHLRQWLELVGRLAR